MPKRLFDSILNLENKAHSFSQNFFISQEVNLSQSTEISLSQNQNIANSQPQQIDQDTVKKSKKITRTQSITKRKKLFISLIEESIFYNESYLDLQKELNDKEKFSILDSNSLQDPSQLSKKTILFPTTTPLPGLIQFLKFEEDPSQLLEKIYTDLTPILEPFSVLFLNSCDFCDRVIKTADGVSFPDLDSYVNNIKQKLKNCMTSDSQISNESNKLIFILINVDKDALKLQRKLASKGSSQNVQNIIDQALLHLTYSHDIEVIKIKKWSEFSEYFLTLTRFIEGRNNISSLTSYNCLSKASRVKPSAGLSEEELEIFEMKQTWSAMLQMVPHVSQDKALALISNPEYSCPKKLFFLMNDQTVSEDIRMKLLQSSFYTVNPSTTQSSDTINSSSTKRNEPKLSSVIYKMMTGTNPDDCI